MEGFQVLMLIGRLSLIMKIARIMTQKLKKDFQRKQNILLFFFNHIQYEFTRT